MQTFEENSTLEGILRELIVPAVTRKDMALREKGLVCLGLCCLIARVSALVLPLKRSVDINTADGSQFLPTVPFPSPVLPRSA